jgi:hypothetical protein
MGPRSQLAIAALPAIHAANIDQQVIIGPDGIVEYVVRSPCSANVLALTGN